MNVSINPEITAILDRYLPDGLSLHAALEAALHAQHQGQSLRVTTCGLLKAGKSSLLNALTDHLKKEFFPTGAARTTIRNQTLSHERFIFVDTPGLDATDSDDAEARKGIQDADVLLFVHHPGTGELHGAEVEFLKWIAREPGARTGLESRLVVILSHLDSHQDDMEDILKRVQDQIRACLGIKPHFFSISFTRYCKGQLENKTELVAHSGIPALRQHLVGQFGTLSKHVIQARHARVVETRQCLMTALDAQIQEREIRLVELQKEAQNAEHKLIIDFDKFIGRVRQKFASYKKTS
jgi:tRNA U34 5-carboxymethylaminomethyl modifying GTPase MnmE/TrmE